MTRDYYAVLGVPRDADTETIRKAYRKLVLEHHTDRGGDPQRFKEINEAWEVLRDPIKRAEYDRSVEDIPAQLILGDPIKSESDDHFGPQQDRGSRADTRERSRRTVVDTRGHLTRERSRRTVVDTRGHLRKR